MPDEPSRDGEPPPVSRSSPSQPLEYERVPARGRSRRERFPQFFEGLLVGSVVSGIIWWTAFRLATADTRTGLFIGVPAVKSAVALVLTSSDRWRRFGLGILTSVGIGFLIFGLNVVARCTI